MPAPVLKFVSIFAQELGYGWSEVHYKQAGSENPNLATALASWITNIISLRRALLGLDSQFVGARVSYPTPNGIASLPNRQKLPGDATHDGAAPSLSLACMFQNSTGTKHKILHMRGFWDECESDGGYVPDACAPFPDWLNNYKDGLIAGGYGWLTRDPATSSNGKVTTYTVGADTRVTFTVEPDTVALPAAGSIIEVRFSRLNNSNSILNRTLLCTVVNATTLKTVRQVGAVPFTAPGRYNYRATTFVAYSAMGSVTLGRRPMGRPLNRAPGRSRAAKLA